MSEVHVSCGPLVIGPMYAGSGGGPNKPHIIVRLASWLAGTEYATGGSPLGPGGRWRKFKAWLKGLVGRQ